MIDKVEIKKFLGSYRKSELLEMEWNVNGWQWDYRLGSKPDNFDEMPNVCKISLFSRSRVLMPYMETLREFNTDKESMRYNMTIKMGMSDKDFRKSWRRKLFREVLSKVGG